MSRPNLADLPPRYQKQIADQLAGVPHPRTVSAAPVAAINAPKRRIRQNSAGLNKTEAAFHAYLISLTASGTPLLSQSITLKLANGVRYTPDFFKAIEADTNGGECAVLLHAYEVKGFMRDDAAVKLKVAAALYPWIKFNLVTKRKGGGWDIEAVLP